MSGKWQSASKAKPCPICGKSRWCRVSVDGIAALCRYEQEHPEFGRGESRSDKHGEPYWLFYTIKPTDSVTPTRSHAEGAKNPASSEERHKVYTAFWKILPSFSSDIAKELDKRKVPKDSPLRTRYRWLPIRGRASFAAKLVKDGLETLMARTPGFYVQTNDRGKYWTIAGPMGLLIPIRDRLGQMVGVMIRPADSKGGSKYLWLTSTSKERGGAKAKRSVHVPMGFKGDTSTVRITEGALKADIATELGGMLCLGTPGLYGLGLVKILTHLKCSTVRLAFDADATRKPNVASAIAHHYEQLTAAGFEVQLEKWNEADGKGIDDLLANGKIPELITGDAARETVASQVKDAQAAKAAARGDRLEVVVTPDEGSVTRAVVEALAKMDVRLFQREGKLVEVVVPETIAGRDPVSPSIAEVKTPNLRGRITDVVELRSEKAGEATGSIHPPEWLAPMVASQNQWPGIRYLAAVNSSPVLRPDGTIHQTQGYDPQTHVFYTGGAGFDPIPDNPTRDDARQAAQFLISGVSQFPWVSNADKSAWASAAVTIAVRHSIRGQVPIFVATAAMCPGWSGSGAGKGATTSAAAIIGTGRDIPTEAYPMTGWGRFRKSEDEEELRKQISAIITVGHPAFRFDEVPAGHGFQSRPLNAATTSDVCGGRILGQHSAPIRESRVVWFLTGNGIRPAGDAVRRTLPFRFGPAVGKPLGEPYEGPEVTDWARQNRPRLFTACLTIVAAYIKAGCPDVGLSHWGGFEAWSQLVRSSLVWAGLPDPCRTRDEYHPPTDADQERTLHLISLLSEVSSAADPLTAAAILDAVEPDLKGEREPKYPVATHVLQTLFPQRNQTAPKLGCLFGKYRDRNEAGRFITGEPNRNGVMRWYAANIPTAGGEPDLRGEETPTPRSSPRTASDGNTTTSDEVRGVRGVMSDMPGCRQSHIPHPDMCDVDMCAGVESEHVTSPPAPPATDSNLLSGQGVEVGGGGGGVS